MNTNNQTSQNNGGEVYTPSTRSTYRFFNANSTIDKTVMSFTYWNSLLKITMNPIQVQEGSANKVDTNNHIDIYLSPSKAQMLLHCIKVYRENPDAYKNIGVNTNKGIIFIANGEKMYGKRGTFIVINLINNENGAKEGEAAYEINTDVYSITDYAGGTDFTKNFDYSESIELDMIETILIKTCEYVRDVVERVNDDFDDCEDFEDYVTESVIKHVKENLKVLERYID